MFPLGCFPLLTASILIRVVLWQPLAAVWEKLSHVHAPSGVALIAALFNGNFVVHNLPTVRATANRWVLAAVAGVETTALARYHLILTLLLIDLSWIAHGVEPPSISST